MSARRLRLISNQFKAHVFLIRYFLSSLATLPACAPPVVAVVVVHLFAFADVAQGVDDEFRAGGPLLAVAGDVWLRGVFEEHAVARRHQSAIFGAAEQAERETIMAGRATEFIGTPLDSFALRRDAKLFFNRVENAYIYSSNSRFHDERLNIDCCMSLNPAREALEGWREDCLSERRRSASVGQRPKKVVCHMTVP
jgi:hypothetical protein